MKNHNKLYTLSYVWSDLSVTTVDVGKFSIYIMLGIYFLVCKSVLLSKWPPGSAKGNVNLRSSAYDGAK